MNRRITSPAALRPGGMAGDPEFTVAQLLSILRRGWWIIVMGAFLGTLAAAALVLRATPVFTAKAQIMLGQQNRADDTLGNLFQEFNMDNADIFGEIAIITSGKILTKVSEDLELGGHPLFNPELRGTTPQPPWQQAAEQAEEWVKNLLGGTDSGSTAPATEGKPTPISRAAAAGQEQYGTQADFIGTLARNLSVVQVGNSYLVDISFTSSDPELAAAVPNTVADVYLHEQLNRKFEAVQRVTTGLNDRLAVLRQRLEEAEWAVVEFRNQNLAAGLGSQERLDQQLRELSSHLSTISAERALISSELSEINALIKSGGATAAAGLFDSPLLDELRSSIASLEQRRSQLSERFGENSPQVSEAADSMARLKTALETEVLRLRGNKANLETVALAKEAALQSQLLNLEQKNLTLSERAVTMAQLERELTANRVTYEAFLGKFTETSEVTELQEADAQVISYAQLPVSPVAPRKKLSAALGFLAGAVLGMGLVLARAYSKDIVTSDSRLRSLMPEAHILVMPRLRSFLRRLEPSAFVLREPQSMLSEAVRSLRSYLVHSGPGTGHAVSVVSCNRDSGKTTTCIMLGRSTAQMGKSCVLVEADMRKGNAGKILGLPTRPDLVDVLTGAAALDDALQPDTQSGLLLLNARAHLKDPAALLMSNQMADLVASLKEQFDMVIFDTPPLLALADAVPLLRMSDSVVLLVREGHTTSDELNNGLRILHDASAPPTCSVLSMSTAQNGQDYGY
ncbi:GumC family protein [Leisingera sp. XS_AS12]|uniref:GumC family protein n=1 Tax=Leisingera sp. XS_AS12 TaxID=3241294 RepID=UPI00351809F4